MYNNLINNRLPEAIVLKSTLLMTNVNIRDSKHGGVSCALRLRSHLYDN